MVSLLGDVQGNFNKVPVEGTLPTPIGADNTVLASDGSAAQWETISSLLDAIFGSTRGMMLRRGAASWEAFVKGTTDQVLTGGANDPTWGTASIAGGGTGQTTKGPAFDALAPTTAQGDLIYRNATVNTRLPAGALATVLTMGAAEPGWAALPAASWTTIQGPTSVGTSATYTVPSLSAYKVLLVAYEGLSSGTATRRALLRVGVAGPTIRTTGYITRTGSVGGSATNTTAMTLTTNTLATAETASGLILISGFGPATTKTVMSGLGMDDSANFDFMYGRYNTAEAQDAIQFLWDGSGNFDGGLVTIWGMA